VRATNTNPATPNVTATRTWTVLPPPPIVAIGATKPTDPTTATDATFGWTISGGGATAVTCSLDGAAFVACATALSQTYNGPLATAAGGMMHTFSVHATNANPASASTPSATASYNWVVAPPLPTVTGVSVTPGDLATSGPFVVNFTVGGLATAVTCKLDSDPAVACSDGQSFPDPGILQLTHTMLVTATNFTGDGTGSVDWTYVP
jgi:hypothetical protein